MGPNTKNNTFQLRKIVQILRLKKIGWQKLLSKYVTLHPPVWTIWLLFEYQKIARLYYIIMLMLLLFIFNASQGFWKINYRKLTFSGGQIPDHPSILYEFNFGSLTNTSLREIERKLTEVNGSLISSSSDVTVNHEKLFQNFVSHHCEET